MKRVIASVSLRVEVGLVEDLYELFDREDSISIVRIATGERYQYLTVVELLKSTIVERFVMVEERVNTALDEYIEITNRRSL